VREDRGHGLAHYLTTGEGPVLGRRTEVTAMRADGTEFPVEVAITPILLEGATMFTAYLRDITERRRVEGELREAKEAAEASSRAKDQFLAALSHELRTPLTPVLAAVSAMLEDPMTPLEVLPVLEMTRRNVTLEARLIDDLLDVTRITQGKLSLQMERVDAHALILRALAICRGDIQVAGLRLEMDLAADAPHVEADPARLQQVFWNLIKNAVKFTPKGGTLAIRSRNEPDPAAPPGGLRLVVEVADTGIGIEPEALPRIFNAFEQGGAAITRQFGGLGLGLAISHSVVERHQGRLTASSAGRDRGATFTLEIAAMPEPAAARAGTPSPAPAPRRALRILLVEDHVDTLKIMARLLGRLGHAVTTADRVGAALEAAAGADFDLIVSDLGLPDGTGLDLIRHLRASRPIPGIALSGFGMEEDVRKSHEAGFTAHLTKPVDFGKLTDAIQQSSTPRRRTGRPADAGPPPLPRATGPRPRPRRPGCPSTRSGAFPGRGCRPA
jgi:signal transduction histidine kinase/ActR/RegA family two-component response regulator